MSIIHLKDENLANVVGGFGTPYETVVVDNAHMYVALNKTDGFSTGLPPKGEVLQVNDQVLIIRPLSS